MRLIECYVNNFGKLSNFHFSFKEGLNVVERENGFGKSTLAAFIKAMLFGLDDTKKTSLSENDRKKYEPWQGGAWGGALSVSFDDKEYRIERSFSKKASLDELKVYELKTGKPCDDFNGTEPGEFFFGIDRDGFERTVFLSERKIDEKKANNTVSAKLSRLTGVAFDMTELDGAKKLLDEERRYYYKHGGGGAISEIKDKITELEIKRAELLALEEKHEGDALDIAKLEGEIKRLGALAEKEIEKEKTAALRQDRYKEYKKKLNEMGEYISRKNEIFNFFGGKIPEKQTVYSAASQRDEILRLEKEASSVKREISELKQIPTESELDCISLLSFKIKEQKEKLRATETQKLNTGAGVSRKILSLILIGAVFFTLGILLSFLKPAFFLITVAGTVPLLIGLAESRKNGYRKGEDELQALISELNENEDRLSRHLSSFDSIERESDAKIYELKQRVRRSEALTSALSERIERIEAIKLEYERIISSYPLLNECPPAELILKIDTFIYLSTNAERLENECAMLMKSFNFTENDESCLLNNESDASEILILKERELALLKNEFSLDEIALEELEEINASLELLREAWDEAKYKYEIIKKTMRYLDAAKDSLTAKYLGKTREAFSKYARLIARDGSDLGIDTSFFISKTEMGQTHAKDAYSKGTRELYEFALRLAFADSLYEGELPFLMLDDPFAYFDDEKLGQALSLIKKLGEDRQIIYFTATKTRA